MSKNKMVLVFNDTINNLLIYNYEVTLKVFILFGLFMFSLYYVFYHYKEQKGTKYFFLGTIRFILYSMSYMWIWLFFLVTSVMLHPAVKVDSILIFIATVYSIGFFMFSVLFITNVNFKAINLIVKFGKVDLETTESKWIKKNYKKFLLNKK